MSITMAMQALESFEQFYHNSDQLHIIIKISFPTFSWQTFAEKFHNDEILSSRISMPINFRNVLGIDF